MASREELRVSLFLRVEVEDMEKGRVEVGLSRNLSASGILVTLEKRIALDREYRVTFSFPGVKRPLQFRARCVRSIRERGHQGTESYLTGFTFLEIPPSTRSDLKRAVQETGWGVVNFLAQHRPFDRVPPSSLLQITGVLRLLPLRGGENCPPHRDLALSMILVRKGLVKFTRPGSRQGKQDALLGLPGQVLGENSLLEGVAHGLRIRALEDSELLVLGPLAMAFLESEVPAAAEDMKKICRWLVEQRKNFQVKRLAPLGLLPAF